MPKLVVNGAMMKCSQGLAPASLTVIPAMNDSDNVPAATVMDFQPNVNIAPFGMCQSTANPQVAAATSAAQGVLTPQPCVPVTTSPWSPGSSSLMIDNKKALTDDSKCNCSWAGTIEITNTGSTMDVDS